MPAELDTHTHGPRYYTPQEIEGIDRNARAYGWEIGHGQPLATTMTSTDTNPFLDPGWRDHIDDQQESKP